VSFSCDNIKLRPNVTPAYPSRAFITEFSLSANVPDMERPLKEISERHRQHNPVSLANQPSQAPSPAFWKHYMAVKNLSVQSSANKNITYSWQDVLARYEELCSSPAYGSLNEPTNRMCHSYRNFQVWNEGMGEFQTYSINHFIDSPTSTLQRALDTVCILLVAYR
jgi:hypothetical protein